jgi:hypothetical protein
MKRKKRWKGGETVAALAYYGKESFEKQSQDAPT